MNKPIKSIVVLAIIFATIFSCGFGFKCRKRDALLLFNSQPINEMSINNAGRNFKAGPNVYYIFFNNEKFKDDYIRVQIVKKEEKTQHWGYKIYWSKDYQIDTSTGYFKSYFVIDEPGYYFMQIFSFDDFDWPIIRNDFWIKQ